MPCDTTVKHGEWKMTTGSRGIRVNLDTIGCKLNQAETELLARQLAEEGYRLVDAIDEADIYILNTCTVTNTADSKSRHMLRAESSRQVDCYRLLR